MGHEKAAILDHHQRQPQQQNFWAPKLRRPWKTITLNSTASRSSRKAPRESRQENRQGHGGAVRATSLFFLPISCGLTVNEQTPGTQLVRCIVAHQL